MVGREQYLSRKLKKLIETGVILTANNSPVTPRKVEKLLGQNKIEGMPQFFYGQDGRLRKLNYRLAI